VQLKRVQSHRLAVLSSRDRQESIASTYLKPHMEKLVDTRISHTKSEPLLIS
jgi:hypothetical protein